MSSRKAQREEARARRLAEEQARATQARRTRRIRMLGGIVLAAVAVVVIAIAISSGGGSKASGLAKGTTATKTVAQVQGLLKGIPQSGTRLGSPTAPVTLYYYGDLQCPVCQAFTLNGFKQLIGNEVRSGKVQVVYRSLETATQDQQTFQLQQVAALAAGQQQRFWNYVELFYHEQGAEDSGYVNEEYLDSLAKQVPGLNFNSWTSARNQSSLTSQIPTDAQQAAAINANATPTLVVKGPKGQGTPASGALSYDSLKQMIGSVE
jgi:protein-disulfide isomerase